MQSCSWVGLTHGSGWVEIFQFLVGWVGSTIEKALQIERIMLMHLKAKQRALNARKPLVGVRPHAYRDPPALAE